MEPPHRYSRLGLIHLLMWVSFSALAAAFFPSPVQLSGIEGIALACWTCLLFGWITTGVTVLLARAMRNVRHRSEPGEWLLLIPASTYLGGLIGLQSTPTAHILAAAVPCLVSVILILDRRLPAYWAMYLLVVMLTYAAPVVLSLYALHEMLEFPPSFPCLRSGLLMALLLLVFLGDVRSNRSYGWLHWASLLGFAAWLCSLVMLGLGT